MFGEDAVSRDCEAFFTGIQDEFSAVAAILITGDGPEVRGIVLKPFAVGALSYSLQYDSESLIVSVGRMPGLELARTGEGVNLARLVFSSVAGGKVMVGAGRGVQKVRIPLAGEQFVEDTYEGPVSALLRMPWPPRIRWAFARPYR
ncbi:hypothetical protein [Xylanimonas sp. McL0601]|uniref:hypothetical protein n=1 Tax=Xylanimonas sp. McL0601 TaxID=3414739 RepID=UPI003CF0F976